MSEQARAALQGYAELSRQVLALALADKWDDCLALLLQRDGHFEQWQALQHKQPLDEETRAIVKETLQCNRQLEDLMAARHQELAQLLHSARQQHKLSSTYR